MGPSRLEAGAPRGSRIEQLSMRNTPAFFRLLSVVVAVAIAITGAVSYAAASDLATRATEVQDNTAPVVIASQELFSAIAEADAASTAVFLSGDAQDRNQRRIYEAALDRAAVKLEEVARLIGDDADAHAALERVSARLVAYAGSVERTRFANLAVDAAADDLLRDDVESVRNGIVPDLVAIGATAQDQLQAESGRTPGLVIVGLLAALMTLAILGASHLALSRRTRRVLHPMLLLAGLLVAGSAIWLGAASVRQSNDLQVLDEGGASSIVTASQMQSAGFARKTAQTLAVVDEVLPESVASDPILGGRDVDEVLRDIDERRFGNEGLLLRAAALADGRGETETVRELAVRWDRYLVLSDEIQAVLGQGEPDVARQLFASANDAFTGFNVTAERVFLGNRDQVFDAADSATQRTRFLRGGVVLAAVVAALVALLGFQVRINDYR